jgi:hypothetical protein
MTTRKARGSRPVDGLVVCSGKTAKCPRRCPHRKLHVIHTERHNGSWDAVLPCTKWQTCKGVVIRCTHNVGLTGTPRAGG